MIKRKICNEEGCKNFVQARKKCRKHDALLHPEKYRLKKTSTVRTARKKKTKPKRKLKTIASMKKLARYWFQRWIRLSAIRNKGGCNCIYGCGKWLDDIKSFDACHYLPVNLYPAACFDPDNVYAGCKGDNITDPTIEYRKNLIRLKGEEFVNTLEDKYQRNRGTYKWDREFLNNIIVEYKAKCKEIEKED